MCPVCGVAVRSVQEQLSRSGAARDGVRPPGGHVCRRHESRLEGLDTATGGVLRRDGRWPHGSESHAQQVRADPVARGPGDHCESAPWWPGNPQQLQPQLVGRRRRLRGRLRSVRSAAQPGVHERDYPQRRERHADAADGRRGTHRVGPAAVQLGVLARGAAAALARRRRGRFVFPPSVRKLLRHRRHGVRGRRGKNRLPRAWQLPFVRHHVPRRFQTARWRRLCARRVRRAGLHGTGSEMRGGDRRADRHPAAGQSAGDEPRHRRETDRELERARRLDRHARTRVRHQGWHEHRPPVPQRMRCLGAVARGAGLRPAVFDVRGHRTVPYIVQSGRGAPSRECRRCQAGWRHGWRAWSWPHPSRAFQATRCRPITL